jgi:hypothetical protein
MLPNTSPDVYFNAVYDQLPPSLRALPFDCEGLTAGNSNTCVSFLVLVTSTVFLAIKSS